MYTPCAIEEWLIVYRVNIDRAVLDKRDESDLSRFPRNDSVARTSAGER